MRLGILAVLAVCAACGHGQPAMNAPLTSSSRDSDGRVTLAVKVKRDCDQEHIQCWKDCWKYKQRDIPKHSREHHDFCTSECLKRYMDCVKAEEAELREFSTMDKALAWINEHKKGIAIGAIVIVAGATFVVVTGGAGALALAPLAI